MRTLDALNAAPAADFVVTLGPIFEHAPWVAEQAAAARPFASVAAMHDVMLAAVAAAPRERRLAFFRGHPELGGQAARAGTMTRESTAEQGALGLDRPTDDGREIAELNAAYQARFGFPFIVCVRRHTRSSILATFRARIAHEAGQEEAAALQEIGYITRLRLLDRVTGPGEPTVAGALTTHVLDAAQGRPAAGVALTLGEVGAGRLAKAVTNAQGRTDAPLLAGGPLRIGTYELQFHIGAYFATALPGCTPFLDVVPIRFRISEPESHYHIPLLVSPGSYTTYRGS